MKLLHILMAAVTLACGGLLLAWHFRSEGSEAASLESTRRALERIQDQVEFRAAVSRKGETPQDGVSTEVNQRGWPVTIDPAWFGKSLPVSTLAPSGSPWIEVAGGEELNQSHPTVRVALDRATAAFWYNPALGIVRARVGPTTSDQRAVELYNRVNGCSVNSIVEDEPAPVKIEKVAERADKRKKTR